MTDERIIAYLLEELPDDELERFEDECFAQEDWPAQISMVEEDLIDAYLNSGLTQERRQRFEQNYLTTEARQERVIMAAALLRQVDEYRDARKTSIAVPTAEPNWADRFRALWRGPSLLRASVALLVASILGGILWLYLSRTPSPRTFATLTLNLSATERSEGTPTAKVTLPLNADALRITLMLPNGSPLAARYRVILVSYNGETKPLEVVEQGNQSTVVVIPADQLGRGQYALQLFMLKADNTEERVGSYLFTIE